MKKLVFIVLLIITSLNLKSQNLINNDSIIINSPHYYKWYTEYLKSKKDSNFVNLVNSNTELKKQFDSTEKYFNLFKRRLYSFFFKFYWKSGIHNNICK